MYLLAKSHLMFSISILKKAYLPYLSCHYLCVLSRERCCF